jgi:ribosomal protein S18 acetylase RimI-like enzyme
MTLAVRRATRADPERIAPLFDAYRAFYGQASDLDRARSFIAERIDRDEAVVLLAELDGDAVGFTLLYPFWSSVGTTRVFVLNDLFVHARARRAGVASALLAAAARTGHELGGARLVLETARDNHAAQALYRHAGWSEEETQWFRLPLPARSVPAGDGAA